MLGGVNFTLPKPIENKFESSVAQDDEGSIIGSCSASNANPKLADEKDSEK